MDLLSTTNTTTTTTFLGLDFDYRVRATFYALTPGETYVQHVKDVPDILVKALPVMFLITFVELLVLRARGRGSDFRLHNAVINYCTGHVNEAGRNFMFRGVELSAYIWVFNHCRLFTLTWNSLPTYLLAVIGVDFCRYWWHRMSHEVSFMWAAHYVHHSCEDLNSSVGARISITMRPFKWMYDLPLALLGLPPGVFLVHSQLNFIWAFWVHNSVWPKTSKLIPGLGHIIDFIVITPSHHRVHHASNKYCIDKNYGSALIVWDRLFGTFAEEREDEPLVYGTLAHKDNNHILGIQADPWRELWGRVVAAKTPADKLRTIFYGPGWSSGQPRLGNPEDIPDVRGRQKHQFVVPAWFSLYLAVQVFVILAGYFEMASRIKVVNKWVSLLHFFYMVLASGAVGGLYSAHEASIGLEPLRLLVHLALCHLLPFFASPSFIAFASSVSLVSLLMWPAVRRQAMAMVKQKTK